MADYKPNEMMTIAAARALKNDDVCFVGIGQPSAACNLAAPPMGEPSSPMASMPCGWARKRSRTRADKSPREGA